MKEEKAKGAGRMRVAATGLLLAMGAMFLAAKHWEANSGGAFPGYLRAFAEAAMIGGLADWFAVVALFRHPLGIPIWHTAVIPRNKDRIGASLGNFVVTEFLSKEVLEKRVEGLDLVAALSGWMRQNASGVAGMACDLIPRVLAGLDDESVKAFLRRFASDRLKSVELAPLGGSVLSLLTSGQKHEKLLGETLILAENLVIENREFLRQKVREEVPVPERLPIIGEVAMLKGLKESIADYVAQKVVDKVIGTLREAGTNPESRIRHVFREKLENLVEALKTSPEMRQKGEELKLEIMGNPDLQKYLGDVWDQIKQLVLTDLASPQSKIRRTMVLGIEDLSRRLEVEKELAAKLNVWMKGAVIEFVEKHKGGARTLIAETVRRWDTREMSAKLESEIGSDLQFIRLNGTLVGGIVGVVLHALS